MDTVQSSDVKNIASNNLTSSAWQNISPTKTSQSSKTNAMHRIGQPQDLEPSSYPPFRKLPANMPNILKNSINNKEKQNLQFSEMSGFTSIQTEGSSNLLFSAVDKATRKVDPKSTDVTTAVGFRRLFQKPKLDEPSQVPIDNKEQPIVMPEPRWVMISKKDIKEPVKMEKNKSFGAIPKGKLEQQTGSPKAEMKPRLDSIDVDFDAIQDEDTTIDDNVEIASIDSPFNRITRANTIVANKPPDAVPTDRKQFHKRELSYDNKVFEFDQPKFPDAPGASITADTSKPAMNNTNNIVTEDETIITWDMNLPK